jgi:hypothetical protein
MRSSKVFGRALASWVFAVSLVVSAAPVHAQIQGQVVAESVPTNSTPFPNDVITVAVNIDMLGVQAPDNRLNAYQASMAWNPAVLKFIGLTPAPAPWDSPTVDTTNVATGKMDWNDFLAGGVLPAKINVLNVKFRVVGAPGSSTVLDLGFSAMTNSLFRSLLGNLTVNDGTVTIQGGVEPLQCSVEIASPQGGANICPASVEVSGTITVIGGVPPYSIACEVNGIAAVVTGSTFKVIVPVAVGENSLIAKSTVIDGQGKQSVCTDTVRVVRAAPPTASVQITSPKEGALVCGDVVEVTGITAVSGGREPLSISVAVNGVNATIAGANFSASVPVGNGLLIAILTVSDGCDNTAVSRDTVHVARPAPLACEVEITSPKQGALICGNSITVTGTTTISGGTAPFSKTCQVNGFPANVVGNEFTATIVLEPGVAFIVASCTVTDGCDSRSFCMDTIRVERPAPPVCEVQITSPADGALICGDSVTVKGAHTISGGVSPYSTTCFVNGVPALVVGNTFAATIPLSPDLELVVAVCTVTDGCDSRSTCRDSVRIQRGPSTASCKVQITAPLDGAIVCDDTLTITANIITDGAALPVFASKVNGVPADMLGNVLTARIPLASGDNLIVVTSAFTDSCNREVVCRDSISVFRDDIVPTCKFKLDGTVIRGSFTDSEGGMARIKPVKLKNAALTVTPFTAGERTVEFRLDAIDPAKPMGFSIDGFDVCGNKVNCDPVALTLAAGGIDEYSFTFPSMDRYLQVTNHGLSEIRIVLNEKRFVLHAAAADGVNAYRMPYEGTVTIDLQPYLRAEEDNDIFIGFAGDAGASAEFLLMDVVQQVDHVLELETIPAEFHLAQNYPNPFNPSTTIPFDVPESQREGLHVKLRVYNLLGELVRTLVDETKLPGRHLALWDGRNEQSEMVSTGIYIYRITAGDFTETRRMTLQK